MRELKKRTSIAEQIQLMEGRGLIISDHRAVKEALKNLNYYRISGYLHDFKKPGTDEYVDGLTWEKVQALYDFDRRFTRILMYALEEIEETLKARMAYLITKEFPDDPLIYLSMDIYRDENEFEKFQKLFRKAVNKNSNLPFVKHHIENYDGNIPMWVAVELFTMGNLHSVYDNLQTTYQKLIAKSFDLSVDLLSSWIESLTYTRNHLAHYMRIYNFNFGRTPKKIKGSFESAIPNMIFDQIQVMSYMYADCDEWNSYILPEMRSIINEYSSYVSLSSIGFPENWEDVLKNDIKLSELDTHETVCEGV